MNVARQPEISSPEGDIPVQNDETVNHFDQIT
jgi:hypothetical protein